MCVGTFDATPKERLHIRAMRCHRRLAASPSDTMGRARRLQTCAVLPGTACSSVWLERARLKSASPLSSACTAMLLVRLGTNNLLVTKCAIYEHRVLSKRPRSPRLGLARARSVLDTNTAMSASFSLGIIVASSSSMIRPPP